MRSLMQLLQPSAPQRTALVAVDVQALMSENVALRCENTALRCKLSAGGRAVQSKFRERVRAKANLLAAELGMPGIAVGLDADLRVKGLRL